MANKIALCPFQDVIQSKLFTFYVGEEKQAFTVHSKAIAATSPYFEALINNNMAESQRLYTNYACGRHGGVRAIVTLADYAYNHGEDRKENWKLISGN
ncbi:hypothetical protein T440DRAFT_512720 [Plenodomus tracheiphilus IPT5]|uniref:BTB domain-containing protein n=1 Tax=Plenodomus tracheiphilus IPT5 TaxID=1408161 RepID=A0A6A7BMV8_9PLEO|nr:hypothetical protein T440DRAFT_512720 [Plenodomus tracheiphilus IPT5]